MVIQFQLKFLKPVLEKTLGFKILYTSKPQGFYGLIKLFYNLLTSLQFQIT